MTPENQVYSSEVLPENNRVVINTNEHLLSNKNINNNIRDSTNENCQNEIPENVVFDESQREISIESNDVNHSEENINSSSIPSSEMQSVDDSMINSQNLVENTKPQAGISMTFQNGTPFVFNGKQVINDVPVINQETQEHYNNTAQNCFNSECFLPHQQYADREIINQSIHNNLHYNQVFYMLL